MHNLLINNPAITRLSSDDSSPSNVRVIAFPFAGGNAGVYHPWKSHLDKNVEVLAYTPPGRAGRFQDKLAMTMEELVDDAWRQFNQFLDKPYILFGHSLGALVAFEFLHKLKSQSKTMPVHFIASARKAPHLKSMTDWTTLNDEEFTQKLDKLGGLHPDIAANKELLELLMPILRADIGIVEQYNPDDRTPLTCPATVFGGTEDANIPENDLELWQSCFAKPIKLNMLDAGHFYLDTHAADLTNCVHKISKPF